jgi:hypothetical protein
MRCCNNTAAAVCCCTAALQTGGVQFRMQLCGSACRNWTLACNSWSVLRRWTRSLSRAVNRSVCLLCCCPPGAATTETNVSPNESIDSGKRGESRSDKVCRYHARPVVQPFQLGRERRKGRLRQGAAAARKGLYCTPRAWLVGARVSTGIDWEYRKDRNSRDGSNKASNYSATGEAASR